MNKYENALVEILNGSSDYALYPIEAKNETKYILFIPSDTFYDDGKEIEVSEETYNLLVELDKDIKGKWEE